jgi:drug/metabolite transporter (DMT)-like permease
LFVLVALWRRPSALKLEKGDWLRYVLNGFVAIVLAETLQPLALRYTSVANLTLLSHGTISLFTAFWALLFFKQRITRSGWVGAAIAFVGVGLVAASGKAGSLRFGSDTLTGDGIAVFRSLEHSLYLLFLARWITKKSPLQVTVYNCVFGAVLLLPYVLWRSPQVDWRNIAPLTWGAFAWTVLPTTLYGFLAWNWGVSKVGAVAASNLFYLMPVSAALSAWALLGEPITPGQALGGLVIIIGVILLRWEALQAAGIKLPDLYSIRERFKK